MKQLFYLEMNKIKESLKYKENKLCNFQKKSVEYILATSAINMCTNFHMFPL